MIQTASNAVSAVQGKMIPLPNNSSGQMGYVVVQVPQIQGHDHSWVAPSLALVGILLGLLGKWLADRYMHTRDMKRDAYMNVAGGVAGTVRAIGKLCDADNPVIEIANEATEMMAPIAKAQIVAGAALSEAIGRAVSHLQQVMHVLLRMRATIIPHDSVIKSRQIIHDSNRIKLDTLIEEQKRYNLDGMNDKRRWDALKANVDFYLEQQKILNTEINDAHKARMTIVSQLAISYANEMSDYPVLWADVLECARKELGFRFNRSAFLEVHTQMAENAKRIAKQSIMHIVDGVVVDHEKGAVRDASVSSANGETSNAGPFSLR